jgi:hypothetical protein
MTDVYSPEIVNSQRNSNTSLQSSTLQSSKGPLNTMFNLQSLRTVKGRVSLIADGGYGYYSVINLYDLSPVKFNNGDIIISLAVSNGSNTFNFVENAGADYPYQQWPQPLLYSTIQFYLGTAPTYIPGITYPTPNNSSGTLIGAQWSPNPQSLNSANTLTNTFNTAGLGNFFNPPTPLTIPILIKNCIGSVNNSNSSCYSGSYQWLNCYAGSGQSGVNPGINVTILVLNPYISQ